MQWLCRRNRNQPGQVLLAAALCALFSACGDGGGNRQAATPTLTATAPARTPTATPPPVFTPTFTATSIPTFPPSQTASATLTPTATPTPSMTQTPTVTQTLTGIQLLLTVGQTESWSLPGLGNEVHVLRTEGNVPHIYASNRRDLAFVAGFVTARDRFFMMDLTRRLGLGRVSELVGDLALDIDVEARASGMTMVADRVAANMSAEHGEVSDAFAAGVNAYIREVQARRLPLPSELRLAGALLGTTNPSSLMQPFTRRDLAGIVAVVMYQSSFETDDVGRDASQAFLEGMFAGAPLGELRRAGLLSDIIPAIDPIYPVSSAAGFGLEIGDTFVPGPVPEGFPWSASLFGRPAASTSTSVPPELVIQLAERLDRMRLRLGRFEGFGSNAWAVAGSGTADGASLLAGDGHLQLDIPPIFYQIAEDTAVLGGGDIHKLGLTIPGFPIIPVGTNGRVAWSQTQLSADITDWYREEIRLDERGLPAESWFRGQWRPLVRQDEAYVIANVPALGSQGRTEVWARWTTFDGRLITAIEGRSARRDDQLSEGESLVMTMNGLIVPADTNGDGKIGAISVDYSGFDVERILDGADGFGRAANIAEFREASKHLIAYSQNIVASDAAGNIFYTSYHAVPCRGYLPRLPDGRWAQGANPTLLLDGTLYGGFTIPMTGGLVDENAAGDDPQRCIVPFDSTPQALNPQRGYVLTANNDPGNIATDRSLENDPWYIGGPWDTGFRADTIDRELAAIVAAREGSVVRMARLQANHESRLGQRFVPFLSEAIDHARGLQFVDRLLSPSEERELELYVGEASLIDEVQNRLDAWVRRGALAQSGVETFYNPLDEHEREDAVATMIFNAWIGRAVRAVWGDEGDVGRFLPRGDMTRVLLLDRFLRARDAGDDSIASYNPDTGESAFFDVLGTPQIESSREVLLKALRDALDFLRSAPTAPGEGGFGTGEVDAWLWGLRHQVRFESLLAPFLGGNPTFEIFTRPFAIDTTKLPLAPNLPPGDPRRDLRWFPRPGDQWGVDAANPGLSGTSFTHGSGPVFRMVFALKDGEVSGLNILPGGQSGLTDSPFFADQARLWLANEAFPVRFQLEDVVAGAIGREVYRPPLAP